MPNNNQHNGLYFPIRLLVFYAVGLTLWRLLFIWYNDVPDRFQALMAAAHLDLSMICGAFLVSFVPYILYLSTGYKFWHTLTLFIQILVFIFVCVVEFTSILIYKEWGSTMDSRAISYLLHPQEAWASVKNFIPLGVMFLGLVILVSGIKRLTMLFKDWQPVRSYYWQSIPFLILIGPLAFLGLRGGWQKLPITPSDAFYSSNMKNNFAAVNKVWYFLYSLKKSSNLSISSSKDEIKSFADSYFKKDGIQDTTFGIWKDKNIVLIIAEGWSADMVGYLFAKEVGTDTVTPFFDSLAEKSIKFTNAFSTGFRTDQGLMSVVSGLPSIQSVNMPNVIHKVKNYPSLPASMKKMGRSTSFIYGGDLNFSNLYNYLTVMGYDTIISDKDFTSEEVSSDWGTPDHITVHKACDIMSKQPNRFFSTLLLLSSHSPFEVPIENEFTKLAGHKYQYMSSVRYSDLALQQFFAKAQKQSWYNNTIFIITSDHGSTHSGWAGMEDHNRFRIPLIVFDPSRALGMSEHVIEIPCNHFDLPTTICEAAGAESSSFAFGRNIFSQDTTRKAYWNVDVAAGCYGLTSKDVIPLSQSQTISNKEPVLFLDMVKTWFNEL